jgi:hypothetical protein
MGPSTSGGNSIIPQLGRRQKVVLGFFFFKRSVK